MYTGKLPKMVCLNPHNKEMLDKEEVYLITKYRFKMQNFVSESKHWSDTNISFQCQEYFSSPLFVSVSDIFVRHIFDY